MREYFINKPIITPSLKLEQFVQIAGHVENKNLSQSESFRASYFRVTFRTMCITLTALLGWHECDTRSFARTETMTDFHEI